jgi:pimeloyl-[acyl-carrier protein] synthase
MDYHRNRRRTAMTATDTFHDTEIDDALISPEMMLDPYPTYERLRDQFPIFWSDHWQAWIVSRYDDVSATLRDNESLSNERRQETLFAGLSTSQREQLARLRHYFAEKDVIGSDPPDHNRIRKLVARAFTPRTISGLQPRITEVAAELLREALGPGRPFDFVAAISHPLPVIVIAEVLGAPVADRPLFKKWSADILAFQGTGTTTFEAAAVAQASLIELFDYMSMLIEDRKRTPREDVITALALAEEDGQRLTRDELLASCNTLLTAGHETTTNLLGNLIRLLLQTGDAWDRVCADRTLGATALEEAFRFDAPKQRNFRRVRTEQVIRGATLAVDQLLFQLIGSANRDPRHFSDPDTFDVTRDPNSHLSLGAGIHFCLGAPLARVEARILLDTILDDAPTIRLCAQPQVWQDRTQFRGPGELWLAP